MQCDIEAFYERESHKVGLGMAEEEKTGLHNTIKCSFAENISCLQKQRDDNHFLHYWLFMQDSA